MCRQDSRVRMSAEEESAAEESLSIYCKPVELYNILQRRAIRNPSFLQRCLRYKIEAMHKKRIQMKISVPGTVNESLQTQNLFPLFIFLARLVSDVADAEYSAVYRFSRVCILTNPTGVERSTQIQAANVILPEINKLAMEAKSGSLAILLVSWVGAQNPLLGINITKGSLDITSFLSTVGGYCLWGKLPFESLYMSWENSPNFSLGQRAEIISTVNMHSCFLKFSCLNEDKCISIQLPYNPETLSTSQQVQVNISAEEIGAQEKSPYNSYLCSDAPSSLSHIIRLRAGNVIFNYRYYDNKLQRTEVTEDFSCPFCLVKCASFKGLRFHLSSSHDLFNFEFWVTEEYQAVNVSVKTDTWRSEVVADGVDPKQQTFFFCSKPLRRRRPKNLVQSAKHVHHLALESDLPSEVCELLDKADDAYSSQGDKARFSGISNAVPQSHVDPDCVQSILGNNLVPPTMLQFAKTRKLSIERSDPRNCALLRKRQFFHSHRAQLMALEQVLADRDSEDEVDDDVADFEDRRMLDDFVDVTKDEKLMMHMWNSFVRKQRVLADGHIPWACEAFSRLHGPDLVRNPALIWCWRLFMIKLWNHGLLDARTMNNCNVTLEQCQSQESHPKP
ncbi:polycomb group protein EMBRYONIC FLOWER 2-like isoform X1 [Juglans microcarpa x Juglans regia]|uniref:polycomb group protein EMBRYONIC FLOWER 2-like isoform X1 n=1 Tax=Juglans microcarpa x Juglans regia TaxID=2249226 RepID=UPI001B7E2E6F|nr:polycomb group protein EMBRYONIC FLOWER 2-like isoform X1 [Juglans microcarpa x Juglans regia]XP_041021485.1 polycomb group protein EMBRYONIC FLOWER 2-like isoform X1 [Juglans microcarpa x Juglans regia]XP_041021487.1 polycomb group protein EMBRYONIC FLOWER 2-like isoform X1 [Juglans microcarpa x Juglans regia]